MSHVDVTKRAEELAALLEGSCEPAPDEVYESKELAERLDELVMLCDVCGWWCETSEFVENDAGEQMCRDCDKYG